MKILRNRRVRSWVLQAAYVGAVLATVATGAVIATRNLRAHGIASGFGFLWQATGWNLTSSMLPTSTMDPYWWFLLMGFLNTLFLGVVGLAGATLVGGLFGLARISTNKAARLLGSIYVETFRNIPMIVQVFFWYTLANQLPGPKYALSAGGIQISNRGIYLPGPNVAGWALAVVCLVAAAALAALVMLWLTRRYRTIARRSKRLATASIVLVAGIAAVAAMILGHEPGTALLTFPEPAGLNIRGGYRLRPDFYALAFSIAIYGGAYIAEIVRGGFNAVSRGQGEAAQALGLSAWQTFSRVRLPLAFRSMLPILANQYVWLIKATTLGVAVGYADLFMVVSSSITQSGQTLELVAILMGAFLILNFTIACLFNWLNRSIALKGSHARI